MGTVGVFICRYGVIYGREIPDGFNKTKFKVKNQKLKAKTADF
jgi:hypothetical protein